MPRPGSPDAVKIFAHDPCEGVGITTPRVDERIEAGRRPGDQRVLLPVKDKRDAGGGRENVAGKSTSVWVVWPRTRKRRVEVSGQGGQGTEAGDHLGERGLAAQRVGEALALGADRDIQARTPAGEVVGARPTRGRRRAVGKIALVFDDLSRKIGGEPGERTMPDLAVKRDGMGETDSNGGNQDRQHGGSVRGGSRFGQRCYAWTWWPKFW